MIFEKHSNILDSLDDKGRTDLIVNLNSILEDAWGRFPEDFIEKHVLKSDKIVLAKKDNEYVGFCCMSTKNILGKKIIYIEFLVIKKAFQRMDIGSQLLYVIIRGRIFKNIIKILFYPLEIMFITPNIRVLSWVARFSKFIYPNPYLADGEDKILPADDKTWKLAQELIKQSDNPGRKIDREGLLLHKSYTSTPWLIYDSDNIPWDADNKVNKFAKKYLDYEQKEGKEFIVRTQIGLLSILKYFIALIFR